jgi:hypothetical protein
MLRKLCLAVLAIAALGAPMAQAQRGPDRDVYYENQERRGWFDRWRRGAGPRAAHWEVLGTQTVAMHQHDRDRILVGRRSGKFSTLKLRVDRNDIFLHALTVRFGNGEEQDVRIGKFIRAGSESDLIDLHGSERAIESVDLYYRARPGGRTEAVVQLLGLEGDAYRGLAGMAPNRPQWELLGEKVADFKPDRDIIPVGRGEGRFSKIRVKVLRHDIDLLDMKVVYLNGQVDDFRIRRRVRDEEPGVDFDLTGERRGIREIVMTYKTRLNLGGQAIVQVYGLK